MYTAPASISTAQEFHEHFSHLTSSLLHSQDSAYRAHLDELSECSDICRILTEELESAEQMVESMNGALKWVEERGESLRIAGESMMQEEVCGYSPNRLQPVQRGLKVFYNNSLN